MTWFPSAALSDYIRWEALGEHTAKATFTIGGSAVSGVFEFSDKGEMLSFQAKRYFGTGEDASLKTWFVKTSGYKDFNGFRIPVACKVVWKLANGDFNWLNLEITQWAYNQSPGWLATNQK
jgi:hypothetical protein